MISLLFNRLLPTNYMLLFPNSAEHKIDAVGQANGSVDQVMENADDHLREQDQKVVL